MTSTGYPCGNDLNRRLSNFPFKLNDEKFAIWICFKPRGNTRSCNKSCCANIRDHDSRFLLLSNSLRFCFEVLASWIWEERSVIKMNLFFFICGMFCGSSDMFSRNYERWFYNASVDDGFSANWNLVIFLRFMLFFCCWKCFLVYNASRWLFQERKCLNSFL